MSSNLNKIQTLIYVIEECKTRMVKISNDECLSFVEKDQQLENLRDLLRGSMLAYYQLSSPHFETEKDAA